MLETKFLSTHVRFAATMKGWSDQLEDGSGVGNKQSEVIDGGCVPVIGTLSKLY